MKHSKEKNALSELVRDLFWCATILGSVHQ